MKLILTYFKNKLKGLIDETFNSLSSLIKTVFRESRTYLLD